MTMTFCFDDALQSAQRGDSAAINELFNRFYPAVNRIVHRSLQTDVRLTRPWLDVVFSTGDIVQDVFFSVLRNLRDFEGHCEGQFINFLSTVTKNRLIDSVRFHEAVRRDRRRVHGIGDSALDVDNPAPSPLDQIATADQVAIYCRVLATFNERDHALLRARLEDAVPFPELREQLGFPTTDATRKAFYAAQAKLLARLRAEGAEA